MARTIQEIYDEMITEKETLANLSGLQPDPETFQTFLQDLTSTSKVAIWRFWIYLVAYGAWVVENLQDLFVAEVTDLKFKIIAGTERWYQEKALEFQNGYSLSWNGTQYVYSTIDTAAQIVKRAAVVDSGGIVRVKVAKLDGNGDPEPLSGAEVTSFTTYIQEIAFAGVNILVTSADADELIVNAKIYYDPLVLSPTGESIASPGTFPVEDAVNGYISNLPFNGIFNETALVDAMQAASGVVDPVLTSTSARYGSNAFEDVVDNYTAFAGHMTVAAGSPLNTTLTYIEA